jgi:hypothetical protein
MTCLIWLAIHPSAQPKTADSDDMSAAPPMMKNMSKPRSASIDINLSVFSLMLNHSLPRCATRQPMRNLPHSMVSQVFSCSLTDSIAVIGSICKANGSGRRKLYG